MGSVLFVGLRGIDPAEQALLNTGRARMIPPHVDLASELKEAIGGYPVYVHLDCDVLIPGIVPIEYQSEGGLTLAELRHVSELIAGNEVIGVEIAEFQNARAEGGEPMPVPLVPA